MGERLGETQQVLVVAQQFAAGARSAPAHLPDDGLLHWLRG